MSRVIINGKWVDIPESSSDQDIALKRIRFLLPEQFGGSIRQTIEGQCLDVKENKINQATDLQVNN